MLKERYIATKEEERIAKAVVDSAIQVHRKLGPGLLEKVYEICLCHELNKREISTRRQVDIPIVYDGLTFKEGLKLDILAGDKLIIEVKAVEQVNPVWEAQIISHLKLTGLLIGFLINFHVPILIKGLKRYVQV